MSPSTETLSHRKHASDGKAAVFGDTIKETLNVWMRITLLPVHRQDRPTGPTLPQPIPRIAITVNWVAWDSVHLYVVKGTKPFGVGIGPLSGRSRNRVVRFPLGARDSSAPQSRSRRIAIGGNCECRENLLNDDHVYGRKWICPRAFPIYWPIWVKFGIEGPNLMPSSSYEFSENRYSERPCLSKVRLTVRVFMKLTFAGQRLTEFHKNLTDGLVAKRAWSRTEVVGAGLSWVAERLGCRATAWQTETYIGGWY